jgi:adenylate cyclase
MPVWDTQYYKRLQQKFLTITVGLKSRLGDIVAGRVAPDPANISIGSARKMDAAVMFFDIRGWTHRSSDPDDEELRKALYTLDTVIPMVMHSVYEHQGFVEKNTGDGVMAVIPDLGEVNAAERALMVAIECFYLLRKLINPHLVGEGIQAIDARIGIDFGTLLFARVGTASGSADQDRNFLTAVGPAANIACRLQQQAGTNEIWVGDAINSRAPDYLREHFKPVYPSAWEFVTSGTQVPYPAWHFDASRPDPLPARASTILTSGLGLGFRGLLDLGTPRS